MEDRVRKQIEGILVASDREALLALHQEAVDREDWYQAHAHLLELTTLLLENSTRIIADARRQQEATTRQIQAVGKRIAALIRPESEI